MPDRGHRNAMYRNMQSENFATTVTNLNYSKVDIWKEKINAINFML